jgi:divalent metal cation (Fe/Co/Zn/Cd) transporter
VDRHFTKFFNPRRSNRFIEFHIQVDPQKTVAISHLLTQEICQAIKDEMPHAAATIHVEPCTKVCNEKCLAG